MTITTMRTGGLALVCTALLTLGLAAGYAGAADPPAAAPTPWAGDPYLLATDPVSGAALPDKPIVYLHEDRELRFADAKSLEEFKAHPAQYLPAVDQKMIAQQAPWYPLGVCVISGEKIGGAMGQPADLIYKNRLVRFCCPGCVDGFKKDPAKAVAKLDKAAIAKQGPGYPLTTCMVSGDKLGGDMGPPVDVVMGNRLVRFCCPDCVAQFKANPAKYLKMLDDAAAKKAAP